MEEFMSGLKETYARSEHNRSITENGAVGYKTTGKALLDLNFSVTSMRSWSEEDIWLKFWAAFVENRELAMKWLFYARDVRGGLGERRLFRVIFKRLLNTPNITAPTHLINKIAEYGRWDDVVDLLDSKFSGIAFQVINSQLRNDIVGMKMGNSVSLLAKWMPSINTSSQKTVKKAKQLASAFDINDAEYRKLLSGLRKYIDVVERRMSRREWGIIDYEHVPSRANLLYHKAFLNHDKWRREEFLDALQNGKAKINAGTLYPYEIVHQYFNSYCHGMEDINFTTESLWKALPNTCMAGSNTLVVSDGSDSMRRFVGGSESKVMANEVASSLAIYFAEKLSGPFKDKYITFSWHPQLVDLSGCNSLLEKLKVVKKYDMPEDTNIQAVFELILQTMMSHHMDQSDMPTNILILSDMEFNACGGMHVNKAFFDYMAKKYDMYGYKLPRLIFWNINSSTNTIPMIQNDLGVVLVSGFSVNTAKMVMSGKMDPYECLVDTLMTERYAPIKYHFLSSTPYLPN